MERTTKLNVNGRLIKGEGARERLILGGKIDSVYREKYKFYDRTEYMS